MKKKKEFCCFCGSRIDRSDIEGKIRDFCPSCRAVFYENPLPVASSIVVNENREVLLVKRKKDPYKDMWCLPIGFAEADEEVKDAALRELEEEAGVKGEVLRIIDVDTVDNYFYGSLAIVTYEVKMIGGAVRPGDDAVEAEFFPILEIPQLAWTSNEKAIRIYIDLYKDIWSMYDSFRRLFPEIKSLDEISLRAKGERTFLSEVLVKLIDSDIESINGKLRAEITGAVPGLKSKMDIILDANKKVLRSIQYWLNRKSDTLGIEEFVTTGKEFRESGFPLPDIITVMALSRKSLWLHLVEGRIFTSPLEIYSTLEINNRIIFFYDKINYFITLGYSE